MSEKSKRANKILDEIMMLGAAQQHYPALKLARRVIRYEATGLNVPDTLSE